MPIQLRKLFDIKSGDYHALHELAPGSVPLVSCGDINHGFIDRFDIPQERRYSNVITVAYNGATLTAKYRPYEFGAKDDIGILLPRQEAEELSLVYVVALINALRWRYSYGRKCFKGKLGDLLIDVPVHTNGAAVRIDNERIREAISVAELDLRPPHGRSAARGPTRTDNDEGTREASSVAELDLRLPHRRVGAPKRTDWVTKRVDEIFHLVRGDFHSLGALGRGPWPTVSRTTNDNGVAGYYEQPEGSNVYPPGTITVSTVGGDAFVQSREFIVTDNVIVLRPRAEMPLETVVLIAAMINQQKWRYGYGRQCYQQKLSGMTVEVPWRTGGLDHDAAKTLVRQQPYWDYFRQMVGKSNETSRLPVAAV